MPSKDLFSVIFGRQKSRSGQKVWQKGEQWDNCLQVRYPWKDWVAAFAECCCRSGGFLPRRLCNHKGGIAVVKFVVLLRSWCLPLEIESHMVSRR